MRTRDRRSTRLHILKLEDRTVPSVTAALVNGVLNVNGDWANDSIYVAVQNGQVSVSGVGQTFNYNAVNALSVNPGDGDNVVTVSPSFGKDAWLFGGNGHSVLTGGGGVNHIYGGQGSGTLIGGPGVNFIFKGWGQNSVQPSPGQNVITNGPAYVAGPANTAIESQIIQLVNQQRAANGLAPLSVSSQLTAAASHHDGDMANLSYAVGNAAAMQHDLNGVPLSTMDDRLMYVGYDYASFGENIAYGFTSAQDVVNAWMNSPGHRANILNPGYAETGVSVRTGANGALYFTQEFGKAWQASTPTGAVTVTGGGTPVATPKPAPTPAPAPAPAPVVTAAPTPLSTPAPHLVAIGAGRSGSPRVIAYDAQTNREIYSFVAFDPRFAGGVRVATGDVTGDGFDDIVAATGPGVAPQVKVFDGKTGQLVMRFFAFETNFTGGVNVAVGDVNGDGHADVVAGAGAGGGPHVKVFSGATGAVLQSFFAYAPNFAGGVNVAAGDVNGDGHCDVITGAGAGGGPHVEAFDGRSQQRIRSFFAFNPGFAGGVNVAAGDVNGDGKDDVICGMASGTGSVVNVFNGGTLGLLRSLSAFGNTFGVRVGSADVNGDGKDDVVCGSNAGMASCVKAFDCLGGSAAKNFGAFDPSFMGGVFVS
jgi:uncharacterized protein YkwD